ncbi:Disease resistance-like protein DSC1 [Vitis vinifera]|uniref:Disease resistance-like protein DSC1 n=1 Tax=Vitis vinifera TaxID=29760 RepID=A0A438FJX7_VITVI|nr:Disease resistance-like protein DSC1 [Vitis vinifera]
MCKKIVREQHGKDTSKWSRLWNPDDIYYAFVSEEGMENVETISLDCLDQKKNGLVSLPSNFHGEKLVAINLKSSNIKELLKGEKCLAELKFIDLSNSQQLIKIPKFSRMPKLEKLNLEGCVSFSRLHSSIGTFSEMNFLTELNFSESGIRELPISIGSLTSLETLNLSKCSKFEKFPDIFFVNMRHLKMLRLSRSGIKELPTSIQCLEALESLWLSGCSNFEKFPEIQKNMENLRILDLDDTLIKELSCLIGHVPRLGSLNLGKCKNLRSVPTSILQLESLRVCSLSHCSNLEIFPEIMEDMEHSKGLSLRESAITELPSSIRLDLSNCENLETLLNSIGMTYVSHLVVRNCPKLHKLPDSLRSMQLKQLDVSCCNLMAGAIPDDLWCLFSLVELNVSGNNIDCIPGGIIRLSRLHTLIMNHCLMLKEIPELPSSLRRIEAYGCPLLETLSSDAKHPLWSSLPNCLKSHIQDIDSQRSQTGCATVYMLLFQEVEEYQIDDDRVSSDGLRLLISDGDQFGHVETINFIPYWSLDMNSLRLPFADPALMVVYFPQIAISTFKVKSCGIHLIYDHGQDHPQQSLQLFNVKRSHDDTEDHPHV